MPNQIEAITFDAAGTLLFPKPSVGAIYQEVLAAHAVVLDPDQLEQTFQSALREVKKDLTITDSEERERAYWKTVVTASIRLLVPLPGGFEKIFEALWQEFAKGSRWTLNKDANEVFDLLDKQGVPYALLTNWDRRVRSVLSDHLVLNRFSRVFISSEIGSEKPDRGIFDFAAGSLNVRPNRILHIGDHYEQDILGARNAGWQAAHFAPMNQIKSADQIPLIRLGELCRLLNSC